MGESRLSEAERAIMQQFWAHGEMGTDQLSALVASRGWKPSTLLTFLSRLVAKGMLSVEKQGRRGLYRPLVSREEYKKSEGQAFLAEVYDGKASDFVAAMADSLPPEELAALRRWLLAQAGEEEA